MVAESVPSLVMESMCGRSVCKDEFRWPVSETVILVSGMICSVGKGKGSELGKG